MNAKNRLIQKLLKVAKKHKILTYPVLALVALISIFSYFFDWSTGAGKRVVAVVMVMVMLVSQSYFLTSSATEVEDTVEMNSTTGTENTEATDSESEETVTEEDYASDSSEAQNTEQPADLATQTADSQEVSSDSSEMPSGETPAPDGGNDVANISTNGVAPIASKTVDVAFYLQNSDGTSLYTPAKPVMANENGTCDLTSIKTEAEAALSAKTNEYYSYTGWYKDKECNNKVGDDEWKNFKPNVDGDGIALYAKSTLLQYKVSILTNVENVKDVSFTVQGAEEKSDGDSVYYDVKVNGGNPQIIIKDIKRKGYNIKGADVTSGTATIEGSDVKIVLTGSNYEQNVSLSWTNCKFDIVYADSDGEAPTKYSKTIEYDGRDVWETPDNIHVKSKPGYDFDHWKVNGYDNLKPGELICLNKEVQGYLFDNPETAVIIPQYKYKGIGVDKREVIYEYKEIDTEGVLIKGYYKNGEEITNDTGNFKYEIVGDVSTTESDYGVKIEATEGGIKVSTDPDGIKKVNAAGVTVNCKITDQDAEEEEKETTFTLIIKINPQVVTVAKQEAFTKTYDGTTECKLEARELEAVGRNGNKISGVKVTFDGCHFDSSEAGNRQIILENAKLDYTSAPSEDGNYTLENAVIDGKINPRPVYVITKAELRYGLDYVRAGEDANPICSVMEDPDTNTSESGLLEKDKGKLNEYVECVITPERNDEKMVEDNISEIEYSVKAAETSSKNPNYRFYNSIDEKSSAIAKFTVKLESPELNKNYEISGTLSPDGWYGKEDASQIKPITSGGYNQIRIERDGAWHELVDLPEGTNLSFQLRDSVTHAFTSWETIEAKVDLTSPEYDSYEIKDESGDLTYPGEGLFFPSENASVTFGNYLNKSVRFVITYKDTLSKPKTLYYTLSGNLGATGEQMVLFGDADGDGKATASFELLADAVDKVGTIQVYAVDAAENKSTPISLERRGTTWVVEQNGPSVDPLVVRAKGVTVDSPDDYYSNCVATVKATDETAGIYGIKWYVNGEEIKQRVTNTGSAQHEATFTLPFDDQAPEKQGRYEVYAVVADNAGNLSSETNHVGFMLDNIPPNLHVTGDYDIYTKKVTVTFDTYDDLSGVYTVEVYDSAGNRMEVKETTVAEDGYTKYNCYFETEQNGTYRIVVTDEAGNQTEEEVVLDKVSSEKPECPEVTFIPGPNEKGWITDKDAVAHITNVTETLQDKMKVYTYYEISSDSGKDKDIIKEGLDSWDLPLPEGKYKLHVWSESRTGVMCDGAEDEENATHYFDIQVDATSPEIAYEIQRETENRVKVVFTVTDAVSGVDKESIRVFNGKEPCTITLEESEDGNYTGSFNVTDPGNYKIQAADLAGNEADEQAFTPMSIKASAVKHITEKSATVGAKIYAGTFGIENVSISYRKNADTVYTEADVVSVVDEAGNMAVSAVLSDLESGTNYVYKITAVSSGDEVVEYEGYFRTLSDADQGVTITGTARYADYRTGIITVSLIKGSNYIRSVDIDMEVGTDFTFSNVPNGSYNLMATDGVYTRTIRVLIEDGKLVYPEDEMIELVLNGMNTTVEVQSKETPDVSAEFSDLDDLLDEEDNQIINDGGTVEYKLTAKLVRVTSIETAALSAMYTAAGTNKIVGAYLDLNLYKIVTDKDGNVSTKRVSKLGGGANVSVTIPLGDLAGKQGLTVVRIHQNGDNYTGKQLTDMDNNPATYTVVTTQFSTYAVLYDKPQDNSPAPDTNTETPDASYQGDDVINSSNQQTLNQGTDAVKIPAKATTAKSTTTSSSVGSLKNYSSAKTGDEAPVAAVGVIFIMAMGGLVIFRRKTR